MVEMVIFTPEIVEQLKEKGFNPVGRSKKAWYFVDSVWLQIALEEIIETLENK